MAAVYGTTRSITPATGSGATSASWTIAGSNLIILVHIGLNSTTATVNDVSWSLGQDSVFQVATSDDDTAHASMWCIVNPTPGSGTYTVNLSASVPYQITADYFTGCDLNDPVPTSDVDTDTGDGLGSAITWNTINYVRGDAIAVCYAHTVVGDTNGFSAGTQTYQSNSTTVNLLAGYRHNSDTMTAAAMTSGSGSRTASIAARIAAAPGITKQSQVVGAAGASDANDYVISNINVPDVANRILLIGIHCEVAGDHVASASLTGGFSFTEHAKEAATSWSEVQLWYLLSPPVGTTDDITIVKSGTVRMRAVAQVWSGVNQTTPFRTPVTSDSAAASVTSITDTVTGIDNDDVLLDYTSVDAQGHTPLVEGANQTSEYEQDNGAESSHTLMSSSQLGVDGGVMSWSWTNANPASHIATALIAAGVASFIYEYAKFARPYPPQTFGPF